MFPVVFVPFPSFQDFCDLSCCVPCRHTEAQLGFSPALSSCIGIPLGEYSHSSSTVTSVGVQVPPVPEELVAFLYSC